MGQFKIEITAVGGHGCDRKAKEGEALQPCKNERCPDCMARAFVEDFKKSNSVEVATLTHWPGQQSEVVDDLKAGTRKKGHF